MSEARNEAVIADSRRQVERLKKLGWYHSLELPDGGVIEGHQSLEQLRTRLRQFPIPGDLRGKRVLDIGAWDGWFSFEMERRGAQVVALDSARNTRLLEARKLLGSNIDYEIGDICRLTWRDLGKFDIVLFLGVLYHVKHPLLALENVCGMTLEMACIESFVSDSDPAAVPAMEFYETMELRGQLDNWVGPNLSCLTAFCRTAGFARVRFESALGERAHVTAWRSWPNRPVLSEAPRLLYFENSATHDHSFSSRADDYVTFYFLTDANGLTCDDVQPAIAGYGIRPIHVAPVGDGWQATALLPPGLDKGWYFANLRVKDSAPSAPVQMGIDRPEYAQGGTGGLTLTRVTDGKSFEDDRVNLGFEGSISAWVEGLRDDAPLEEVRLRLNGSDLPAIWLAPPGAHARQINALLPSGIEPGAASVSVVCGFRESASHLIELRRL